MSEPFEAVIEPVTVPAPEPLKKKGGPPGSKANQYRDEKGRIRVPKVPPKVLTNETHPLADVIEWVILHPPGDDFTHEQKFYRQIKDKNPAEFHKMRESFKKPAPVPAGESEPDPAAEAPFPELEEAWQEFQEYSKYRSEFLEWKAKNTA